MREAHTQRNGKYGRLARAAELARAAVEKECPAELLEAAFGLPRCVAMLLSCVIVLRLLIALAAEVCWRCKCAQAAACGHEGTLEQLSAGCRRLRMASGRPGAARCLSLRAIIIREMVLRRPCPAHATDTVGGGLVLSEEAF